MSPPASSEEGGRGIDRPQVLFVRHGEVGERIEEAIRRVEAVPIEASDGTDAIKRLEVESLDLVVVPASLPDVRVETIVGRLADKPGIGPCVVVGEVDRIPAPMIQVEAEVPVETLAERIRQAIRDRRIGQELSRYEQLKTAILRVAGAPGQEAETSVMSSVFDQLRTLNGYRFVWIGSYDRADDVISFVEPLRRRVPLDALADEIGATDPAFVRESVDSQTVTQSNEPIVTRSVASSTSEEPTDDRLVVTTVPLVDSDRTVGVLVISTRAADAPDGSERALLAQLGRLCGLVFGRESTTDDKRSNRVQGILRVIAHELRNPLQIASFSIDAAREGDKESLERAAEAVESMSEIIDATVSMSKTGGIESREPVDVHDLALKIWRDVRTSDAELTIAEPVTVEADPALFERLLSNLLRNAVDHAGMDVSVRVGGLPGDRGFYVEDDGPGIPPEQRESVFEWGDTSSVDGLGVGLGFVSEIADAHDWNVSVREGADGGARFEVVTNEKESPSRDELRALFDDEVDEFVYQGDSPG